MTSIEEKFDITGVPRRSAYLFFQLAALHLITVFSLTWGPLRLPVLAVVLFLAVYVTLRQVEGVVEDKLNR
jgi:hypothetical protein